MSWERGETLLHNLSELELTPPFGGVTQCLCRFYFGGYDQKCTNVKRGIRMGVFPFFDLSHRGGGVTQSKDVSSQDTLGKVRWLHFGKAAAAANSICKVARSCKINHGCDIVEVVQW